MYCFHKEIEKEDLGNGIIFQDFGVGHSMNVFHWNMSGGSVVKLHTHPEEQFGYIIKGCLEIDLSGKKTRVYQGDAYFIPPNAPHSFMAIGETEAIDVFTPKRSASLVR